MINFWRCAFIRAIRTMAQTAVATIGTTAVLTDIDWKFILSSSLVAGILSILTSIATGLPEVDYIEIKKDEDYDDEDIEIL